MKTPVDLRPRHNRGLWLFLTAIILGVSIYAMPNAEQSIQTRSTTPTSQAMFENDPARSQFREMLARALSTVNRTSEFDGISRLVDQLVSLNRRQPDEIRAAAIELIKVRDVQGRHYDRALVLAHALSNTFGSYMVSTARGFGEALRDPTAEPYTLQQAGLHIPISDRIAAEALYRSGRSNEARHRLLIVAERQLGVRGNERR